MTEQAEKLREALCGYRDFADICDPTNPEDIASTVCDTLGITREMVKLLQDATGSVLKAEFEYSTSAQETAEYLKVVEAVEVSADAFSALLEVAGR